MSKERDGQYLKSFSFIILLRAYYMLNLTNHEREERKIWNMINEKSVCTFTR
jgi:hypothetical protein